VVVVAPHHLEEQPVFLAVLAVVDRVIMLVHIQVALEHPVKEMLVELVLMPLLPQVLTEQQVVVALVQ
jgi:hypothetical protein